MKVPHIGWNSLNLKNKIDSNQKSILQYEDGSYVYFIHSFMVNTKDSNNIVATTNYGGHNVVAAVNNKNITGLHSPEKSGAVGLKNIGKLLENMKRNQPLLFMLMKEYEILSHFIKGT